MAAAYTQALLDQATAYLARPLNDKRSPEGLAALARLHADITGEPAGSCRQCQYSDFVSSLSFYIREATRFLHPDTVADTKYTFAPGYENETIVHESYGKAVTLETLTDEDAKALRKLGFDKIIIEKGAKAKESTETTTEVEPVSPLVPQADLEKEQAAHATTRQKADQAATKAGEVLKAEKAAHGETKKALTAAGKQVTDLQTQLDKALADLATATTPQEPAAQ